MAISFPDVIYCAGLIGGRTGFSAQGKHRRKARSSEAVHGSAPDIAGKGCKSSTLSPTVGNSDADAHRKRQATEKINAMPESFAEGEVRTRDALVGVRAQMNCGHRDHQDDAVGHAQPKSFRLNLPYTPALCG